MEIFSTSLFYLWAMLLFRIKRFYGCKCLLLHFLFPLSLFGQSLENPVSSLKGKRNFIYGVDNRRTHIKGQSTIIYGAYLGLGFDEKLRFKLGISGTPFNVGKTQDAAGLITRHRLVFLTLGEEFDFYIKNRFRLTTYFQAGLGFDYSVLQVANGPSLSQQRKTIVPLEFGFHANYDLFPWLRAKLGGGWRFVLPLQSRELSGYYVKIGFGFYWSKFNEHVLKKERK